MPLPIELLWADGERMDQINLKTTAPCPANTGFKCHSGQQSDLIPSNAILGRYGIQGDLEDLMNYAKRQE